MKIYLDVDDTLADFREHAVARGVPRWEGSWYTTDPATWTDEQKFIQAETNRQMSMPDFWLTMPVADRAFELIAAASARGEVYLLTALPSFAKEYELRRMIELAKREYASEVLHFDHRRTLVVPRAEKVKYATAPSQRPEEGWPEASHLLVDDAHQNIREWTEAGGFAIHHEIGNMAATIAAVKRI